MLPLSVHRPSRIKTGVVKLSPHIIQGMRQYFSVYSARFDFDESDIMRQIGAFLSSKRRNMDDVTPGRSSRKGKGKGKGKRSKSARETATEEEPGTSKSTK